MAMALLNTTIVAQSETVTPARVRLSIRVAAAGVSDSEVVTQVFAGQPLAIRVNIYNVNALEDRGRREMDDAASLAAARRDGLEWIPVEQPRVPASAFRDDQVVPWSDSFSLLIRFSRDAVDELAVWETVAGPEDTRKWLDSAVGDECIELIPLEFVYWLPRELTIFLESGTLEFQAYIVPGVNVEVQPSRQGFRGAVSKVVLMQASGRDEYAKVLFSQASYELYVRHDPAAALEIVAMQLRADSGCYGGDGYLLGATAAQQLRDRRREIEMLRAFIGSASPGDFRLGRMQARIGVLERAADAGEPKPDK